MWWEEEERAQKLEVGRSQLARSTLPSSGDLGLSSAQFEGLVSSRGGDKSRAMQGGEAQGEACRNRAVVENRLEAKGWFSVKTGSRAI
mgnify:CR=1 FL=1